VGSISIPSLCYAQPYKRNIPWQAGPAGYKKTEFLPCKFSDPEGPNPDIFIGGEKLMVSSRFKYLDSVVNNKASCDDGIKHRTSVGWVKWRENSSVFCDKKIPRKLKGKLYATVVRPALLYASEC